MIFRISPTINAVSADVIILLDCMSTTFDCEFGVWGKLSGVKGRQERNKIDDLGEDNFLLRC